MPDKKFLGACSPRVRSPAQKSARRAAAPVGSAPRRDLIEPELFGNEAGDDEPVEVLSSYFLDKPEFEPFYQPATKLAFVRSRKGVGKSALLKQTYFRRQKTSG